MYICIQIQESSKKSTEHGNFLIDNNLYLELLSKRLRISINLVLDTDPNMQFHLSLCNVFMVHTGIYFFFDLASLNAKLLDTMNGTYKILVSILAV